MPALASFTYASAAGTNVKVLPEPTGVAVEVMVGVGVLVGIAVWVGVLPAGGVAVGLAVEVKVAVLAGVCEGVGVDVNVGVAVDTCWKLMQSSGRWLTVMASLLLNLTSPIAPEERNNRPWLLRVPFTQPCVTAVTSISRY